MGISGKRPGAGRDTADNGSITISRTLVMSLMQEHTRAIANYTAIMDPGEDATEEQAKAAIALAASTLRLSLELHPLLSKGDKNELLDQLDSSDFGTTRRSDGLDQG